MVAMDLSSAIFFTTGSGGGGTPYGKYEDGAIVANIGWPDFFFPGVVLDESVTYTVTYTYSDAHPLDDGGRDGYAGPTLTDQSDLGAMYSAWDFDLWLDTGPGTDTFSFEIAPPWYPGFDPDPLVTTPVFETDRYGALIGLDIDPAPGGGGGPGPGPAVEGILKIWDGSQWVLA